MIRSLTDTEAELHGKMQAEIESRYRRNKLKLDYYDMKHRLDFIGFSIPDDMKELESVLGWAEKATRTPVDRINRVGFTSANKDGIIQQLNELDDEVRLEYFEAFARLAAAMMSCSFMFFSKGDTSKAEPPVVISVRDATAGTAQVCPRTGRTTAALEVINRDNHLLYLPGLTLNLKRAGLRWVVTDEYKTIPHRVACTVYRWRPELRRPFGYSRISRAVMGHIDRACRTILRQEVNAEFYSSPRGVLLDAHRGAFFTNKGERIDPLRAIGAIWGVPGKRDNETGDWKVPKFEQLAQANFQPHTEMMKSIAMNFHAETDIPLGQLGVVQDNPSSADAIRAAEHGLIALCRKEIRQFTYTSKDAALNVLALAEEATTEGELTSLVKEIAKVRPKFGNPATPTPSSQADSGSKFVGSFPDLQDSELALEQYGLEPDDVERALAHIKTKRNTSVLQTALDSATTRTAPVASEAKQLHPLEELKLKAETLGQLRRAGVTSESAAEQVQLEGLKFMPGAPVTIRADES